MERTVTQFLDSMVKILIAGIFIAGFIRVMLFTIAWNSNRLNINYTVAQIEDRIDKIGYIERSYVDSEISELKNRTSSTYRSLDVTVSPSYDTMPRYIGQPMYVELSLKYKSNGKERTIKRRASAYNRGYYGSGYNTRNRL